MNAYVFGMSIERFALTSAALAALVNSFTFTKDSVKKVSIRLLDESSRPLGRRKAYGTKTAAAAIEAWETGAAQEIELVAGSADAAFDESNYISLRRCAAERSLSASAEAYLHCLLSLPLDWRPLISHVTQQLLPGLHVSYAFVHSTQRMLCASSELLFATSPDCVERSGTQQVGSRFEIAFERDRWIAARSSEIGDRLLDVYWLNFLSGSLKDRVVATITSGSLEESAEIEHVTPHSVLIRIGTEPRDHHDALFIKQRSTVRAALRDHCVLRDWSGFR